jgi:magnesium chelatase subunit I
VGGAAIARELIRRAADATLKARAGKPNLDDVIVWFDEGSALQVDDELSSAVVARAFATVPGLLDVVHATGLATPDDPGATAAACELVLEALVARRKISRSDAGQYGRAQAEPRRRPGQDSFGGWAERAGAAAARAAVRPGLADAGPGRHTLPPRVARGRSP